MNRLAPILTATLLCLFGSWAARADIAYFLVTEHGSFTHWDSYVLPLSDPNDIQHARDLIAFGPAAVGQPIVNARIAPGGDGINGDYLIPPIRYYHWRVVGFEGFSDISIELYDGWPTYVEEDVDGWMQNTGGHIAFWGYTVTSELQGIPEPSIVVLLGTLGVTAVGFAYARRRRQCRNQRSNLPPKA